MSNQIYLVDDSGRWTPEVDPFTTHRAEAWRWDLLDFNDSSLGPLDGVSDGSLSFNVNATIRGGGSCEYEGAPVNWLSHRLQPWYRIEAAGKVIEWPLGVFIPAAPSTSYEDGGRNISIELYDKTHLLDRDQIENTASAPKGTPAIARVKSILQEMGERKIAIADNDEVLSNGIVWEVGTSKLAMINELLEAVDYFALWVDGYGTFRADPYKRPADRPQAYGFVDDETSIYSPDFVHDFDNFDVPNKVICIGQTDGTAPAKRGVATNTNPSSPYSYSARGNVWITRTEEGVEATSQAVLDALALRYLNTGKNVGSTFDIQHAPIQLNLNDLVGFRRDAEDIGIIGTVETITYSMAVGALCQTKIREVQ